MAPKKRPGHQPAQRSGAKDSGPVQKHRGAKGHAETPAPRTGEAAGEDAAEDDDSLADADETDDAAKLSNNAR
jgi:hypothetical protein